MRDFVRQRDKNNCLDSLKVFMYGTFQLEHHDFERFCAAKVDAIVPACVEGKLYQIPDYMDDYALGYPAMTLEEGWVKGYLFEFKDAEILTQLDYWEGYTEGRSPEENECQRLWLPIFNEQQETLTEAWVYVMTPEKIVECGGFPLHRHSW